MRASWVALSEPSGVRAVALALVALAAVVGGPAAALDQNDLQRLQQMGDCQGCDFSGGQLAGARLSGGNLAGANLEGADLRGASLVDVDLSNADVRDADLSGALVQNVSLRGAMLGGAVFTGTVFVGTDFSAAQGLTQWQLNAACDDQRANVSSVPIPLSLPPCR